MIVAEFKEFSIRTIERENLKQLLAWRNDPSIHSKMLTDHIITWEEHLRWYEGKILPCKPAQHFETWYQNTLIGCAYIIGYDEKKDYIDSSSYLRPDFKQFAPSMAALYIAYIYFTHIFETWSHLNSIITEVLENNPRVFKYNVSLGFEDIHQPKEFCKNGKILKAETLQLTREKWMKRKEFVRQLL